MSQISTLFQQPHFGLLFMRLSIGSMMAIYGFQKFLGGEKVLRAVGAKIQHVGIEAAPESVIAYFFGIVAAGTEFLGGIFLILGFLFRTASFFLFCTMVVATLSLYASAEGDLSRYGYPLSMMLILFGFLWTGPGRISISRESL